MYNIEDWESTYSSDQDGDFFESCVEDTDKGVVIEVGTLIEGPKKYAARVPLSFDDEGDWEDWENQLFDTLEEAKAAANRTPDN